jgi:hypothetical protein
MSIVFFDLEASSLVEGFPIEVGWAWVQDDEVRSEGHLIRPSWQWLEMKSWDPAAEALHGISRDMLKAEGKSCAEVAARMNEALAGRGLVSDSPSADTRWLWQMLDEAGTTPTFQIANLSADALIVAAAEKLGILDLEYTWVEKETARLAPRTHRAAADAAYWATFFSLLQHGQEELARRREAAGIGIALSPTRWKG